jgi:GT2 family glycosyltransferase
MANSYSVIIPSRNIGNLTKCVSTLRAMGEVGRIIVVWDGNTRDTDEWFDSDETKGPLMIDEGRAPFVFARNINIGIRAAGADDVVLLNDDALLQTPAGFLNLRIQAQQYPEFGAICPSFTPGSVGTPNLVWRGRPSLAEEKVMLVFACVYIPRSTIDKVGLLDERFAVNAGGPGSRGYGLEDDDYSLRIRQAHMKLGVYDGVLVDHVPESTGLQSTFRHDPEHPHDVRAHEELFVNIHGHWPEGHGWAPGKSKL